MNEELFDKMLRAAILKDRINYTAGLLSELQVILPFKSDIEKFKRDRCQGLLEDKNSLGVEPLNYERMLSVVRENVLEELFPNTPISKYALAKTDNGIDWEQRKWEITAQSYLLHIKQNLEKPVLIPNIDINDIYAQLAIEDADALIKELKSKEQ